MRAIILEGLRSWIVWMMGFLPLKPLLSSLVLLAAGFVSTWASAEERGSVDRFRVYAERDTVVRLDHAVLVAQGFPEEVASDSLALSHAGEPVPIHLEDGGDGRFGSGDRAYFVAHAARQDDVHVRPDLDVPVYMLTIDPSATGARVAAMAVESAPEIDSEIDSAIDSESPLRRRVRLEQDLLRVPVAGRTGFYENETLWFWQSMNHLASLPTRVPLQELDAAASGSGTITLAVRFGGGSDAATSAALKMPDHVIDVTLNGHPVGTARFSGRSPFVFEVEDLPASWLLARDNRLELRVPPRRPEGADAPLIDVVQLDWVEIEFPVELAPAMNPGRVSLARGEVLLWPAGAPAATLYSETGGRAELPVEDRSRGVETGLDGFWILAEGGGRPPVAVEAARRSHLRSRRDVVDYFVIAPSDLLPAVQPLVDLHRQRGLRVEPIGLQAIYDEFNHGRLHPRAIRDFLSQAHDQRPAPAPRFVLLVGDADWWTSGQRPAERGDDSLKNGVPTWQIRSRDGPVASDLPFVDFGDDPWVPTMAIGRFPVSSLEEAHAMVDKTVAYLQSPPEGDWRDHVVLASERSRSMEQRNDRLSSLVESQGRVPSRRVAAASNASKLRDDLRQTFDDGALLVHFFGHGGRFMWQVGARNGGVGPDLFSMDDLDRLVPNGRQPVVLSLSCNTAPFDHPSADSLAEKMLRLPDRGAVAVIAASARNNPLVRFSESLVDELLSGQPVGQALVRAKSVGPHPDIAYFYNLLGDPALVLAADRSSAAAP